MRRTHALRLAAAAATTTALALAVGGTVPVLADQTGDAEQTSIAARAGSIDLRIDGRGFGHGRGMSQYGAQGRALAGRTAREILDFYYPGTGTADVRGRIRVLLSTPDAPGMVVGAQRGLSVERVATGASWELPRLAGVKVWRLRYLSASTTTLEYLRDGSWRPAPRERWRSIGGDAELGGGGPVELFRKGVGSSYRGAVRTYGGSRSDMSVVNAVNLNGYLFGVVPAESPASWEPAALQAQSVAARTYAQFHRAAALEDGRGFDLCDTTACQVYDGLDAEYASTNAAVRATTGTIRTWAGEPIIAEFSSSNGGQTVGSLVPYQVFRRDRYDDDVNPNASWTERLDGDTVAAEWDLGTLRRVRVLARDGHGEWGGRVTSLRLAGSERSVTVSGDDFRIRLGLRSTYVDITAT